MIEELSLFSVPVIKIKTKNWEQKKDRLLALVDLDNPSFAYPDVITDYHANSEKGVPYLAEFCNIVQDELKLLLEKSKGSAINMNFLWAQRYKKSNYMIAHTHGPIGYSATLYTEFDKSCHPSIRFISPIHDAEGGLQFYEPDIDEGDLIAFPSFLMHDVRHSTTDKSRTIFAFNYKVVK